MRVKNIMLTAILFISITHQGVLGGETRPEDAWRDAFSPPLLEDLGKVTGIVGKLRDGANMPRWGDRSEAIGRSGAVTYYDTTPVVAYSNKDIQEVVVDFWLAEYARYDPARPIGPAADAPPPDQNPWYAAGEGPAEYLDWLVTVAQSTLSPRIYDYMLFPVPWGPQGDLRLDYLARVNPESTVETIIRGMPGSNPDYWYWTETPGQAPSFLPRSDVCVLLTKMCGCHPEVIKKHKGRLHKFIREVLWWPRRNYDYFNCALSMYEVWADPAHIPEIEKLRENAPILPDVGGRFAWQANRFEQIPDKVERILREKFGR